MQTRVTARRQPTRLAWTRGQKTTVLFCVGIMMAHAGAAIGRDNQVRAAQRARELTYEREARADELQAQRLRVRIQAVTSPTGWETGLRDMGYVYSYERALRLPAR